MKKFITSAIATSIALAGFSVQGQDNQFAPLESAKEQQLWITMGQDAMNSLEKVGGQEFLFKSIYKANSKGISVAKIGEGQLNKLSRLMHKAHNRCGGYMVHDSLQSALVEQQQSRAATTNFVSKAFNQADAVNRLVPDLAANNIVDTITYLSTNFNNRYYTTTGGSAASDGLKARWENIVAGLPYAQVNQISHSGYGQKSVEVVLTGAVKPEDIVVIGGHLDSTIGSTSENSIAPGADDDASGIATLTEVMRVFVSEGVQPNRTVKFYAYAAEEVGLRGSGDIADAAAAAGDNVVGVMQLDMTNYDGAVNDITLMTDYTSATQNSYIQDILNTYFGSGSALGHITHGTDSCGYGCSDHASWNSAGFPASMPFETPMSQYNPRIHTSNDTLANMDTSGAKALKFAQMALAYVIELSADTTTPPPPQTDYVLTNGVTETGLTAATGSELTFTMDVPAGATNINFAISGGTGDADLYTRFGAAPTDSVYDCRPYASGNNESCTGTATDGTYYGKIKAYSGFSGLNLVGSYDEDGGGTGGLPTVNETINNISLARRDWSRHTQELQAGYSALNVTLTGGSGNADLYVRFGANSTKRKYDCRSNASNNEETCTINNPQAGTWHIDVYGTANASGVTLSWQGVE